MKKIILGFLLLHVGAQLLAQSNISPSYSFDIRKKIDPPILSYVGEVKFIDANGNRAIDANEKCALEFTIENSGKGDALNLRLS